MTCNRISISSISVHAKPQLVGFKSLFFIIIAITITITIAIIIFIGRIVYRAQDRVLETIRLHPFFHSSITEIVIIPHLEKSPQP